MYFTTSPARGFQQVQRQGFVDTPSPVLTGSTSMQWQGSLDLLPPLIRFNKYAVAGRLLGPYHEDGDKMAMFKELQLRGFTLFYR